jgi:hypothetical protein
VKRPTSRRSPTKPQTTATNTVHYACFSCRKAFKQRGSSNWDHSVPIRPFPCPECKRPMARMGKYFQVPPQRAFAQWEKVELLYHYGEDFEASGKNLSMKCRTLASTIDYLTTPHRTADVIRKELKRIRRAHKAEGAPQPSSGVGHDEGPEPDSH